MNSMTIIDLHSWLSRQSTARGCSTGLVPGGPAKEFGQGWNYPSHTKLFLVIYEQYGILSINIIIY